MTIRKSISMFVLPLLIFGFIFLALPEKGYAGTPSSTFGSCCIDSSDGECITCEFFGCAYSRSFCQQELGGDFDAGAGGVCVSEQGQARCGDGDPGEPGCCVIAQGSCQDEVIRGNCFDDQGEGAEFWVFNESCSNVPECEPTERPIPTLNHWGLITLAGVLGIIGFLAIRKRMVRS